MDKKDQLIEHSRLHVKTAYKTILFEIESLKEEFDERFRLLQDQLGPEYLPLLFVANPFTDDRFMRIRKRVLDVSNNALRSLETEYQTVSFVFKQD